MGSQALISHTLNWRKLQLKFGYLGQLGNPTIYPIRFIIFELFVFERCF